MLLGITLSANSNRKDTKKRDNNVGQTMDTGMRRLDRVEHQQHDHLNLDISCDISAPESLYHFTSRGGPGLQVPVAAPTFFQSRVHLHCRRENGFPRLASKIRLSPVTRAEATSLKERTHPDPARRFSPLYCRQPD